MGNKRWLWPLGGLVLGAALALALGVNMGEGLWQFTLAVALAAGLAGLVVALVLGKMRTTGAYIGMGLGCGCGSLAAVGLALMVFMLVAFMSDSGEHSRALQNVVMPIGLWAAITIPLCAAIALGGVIGYGVSRKRQPPHGPH